MLLLVAIISDILGHPNFVRVLSEKIRESKEGYIAQSSLNSLNSLIQFPLPISAWTAVYALRSFVTLRMT